MKYSSKKQEHIEIIRRLKDKSKSLSKETAHGLVLPNKNSKDKLKITLKKTCRVLFNRFKSRGQIHQLAFNIQSNGGSHKTNDFYLSFSRMELRVGVKWGQSSGAVNKR